MKPIQDTYSPAANMHEQYVCDGTQYVSACLELDVLLDGFLLLGLRLGLALCVLHHVAIIGSCAEIAERQRRCEPDSDLRRQRNMKHVGHGTGLTQGKAPESNELAAEPECYLKSTRPGVIIS